MSGKEAAAVIVGGAGGIVLALFLWLFINKWNIRKNKYPKKRQYTIVQNGMNIKAQKTGSGSGAYFAGNKKNDETYVIETPDIQAWNISLQNQKTGEVYRQRFRGKVYIGRKPNVQSSAVLIVPDDVKISKVHCVIYEDQNTLFLADMNSKNHTWLNACRIQQPTPIKNGDQIRIGDTNLLVEYGK